MERNFMEMTITSKFITQIMQWSFGSNREKPLVIFRNKTIIKLRPIFYLQIVRKHMLFIT